MRAFQRLLACCVFTLSLFGQGSQGSVTGSVTDQTDSVIANAAVELRNTNTGVVYTGGASATGNYVIQVPQGTYELTVAVTGFKKYQQTGIPVIDGQATRRNVQLEIGQASEVITVTDTQPLLKTETGDISYRVTGALVNQLPVLPLGAPTGLGNIRNPLYMTVLVPGVQYSPAGSPGVVFQTLTVNGLPANSQTFTIEGQDSTPSLWRGVTSDRVSGVGIEAVEAMQMQTSNFAAEYGKTGGAAINYTMKSGTNQYHGSAFNYWVNEFMHAGTPYTDYADLALTNPAFAYKSGQHIRDRQRRWDFGGTIGGPIKLPGLYNGKDKAFFFFNFEQFRQTTKTATGVATVPTLAYRAGDFTASGCNNFNTTTQQCNPGGRPVINDNATGQEARDVLGNPVINGGIYDTNSYQIVNGQPVRTLLANQFLPPALFDTVSQKIQQQFPLPTNNNLVNNYTVPAYTNYRTNTIPSVKLDYNLNPSVRIGGFYQWQASDTANTNGFAKEQFPWTAQQFAPLRSHTIRVNLDATITPTLLLHIGVGYYHYREPNVANKYDQSLIGLPKAGAQNAFPAADVYPTIAGINSFTSGGFSPGIGAGFDATAWEQKPTGNLNLTWIKNNHTFKFGGDTTLEGYITHNKWRANGNIVFNAAQAGNPWTDGKALSAANPTGFPYAAFLQGQPNSMELAQQTFTRLGGHAFAFFAQDNWKVTPKLTVELGLRYDFQTYLKEQHGRHASAAFDLMNPTVGRPGGIAYEGSCGCNLSSNYKMAFGPRVSLAYQITPKTVFRAGGGVNYNVVQTPAGNNFSVGDFYSINSPGFGISPLPQGLEGGNTYYPGNPGGFTPVIWPVFDPGRIPPRTAAGLPPASPFSMYHPDSRPGRIYQWSVGMQHEVVRNLVIEASYVGNRGAWFYSPLLDTMAMNTLGGGQLARHGLDIRKEADRTLLSTTIGSPQAAQRGFFLPYVGFPGTQQVGQAIRPIAQWGGVNPYLGPFRGNTWYDSLQFQATKRYSHNLDLSANVTWAHASALGASADTDFFFAGRPQLTDPFNRQNQKQLNQLVSPLKTVISGTYTTPKIPWTNGFAGKMANLIVKDWQVGAVLQYQSGQLITTPTSNNALASQLRISGPGNFFPIFYNPWNYAAGSSFFRPGFDPNGDFDPRAGGAYATTGTPAASTVSVLTGGFQTIGGVANQCGVAQQASTNCAWTDPAPGEWGNTAPYLEGFRWRRRPSESFNVGRNFRFGKDGRYNFQLRAEFTNILNRLFFGAPSAANPTAAVGTQTVPSTGYRYANSGYGVVSTFNGAGSSPRQGTIVGRFTF